MALLSFADAELQSQAKFTILVTSILAAITGYAILLRIKKVKP
jgi:NhaA family Na+:H+ antiporter